MLGLSRFPADTGGKVDICGRGLAIQVRSGLAVVTTTLRDGMADAEAGAAEYPGHIPCVVLIDRRPAKLGRYIVFRLESFIEHFGFSDGTQQE